MKQKQPKFSGILVVAVLMVLVLFIVSLSPLLAASGSKDTTYSEIYYYFENQQVTSFRLDLGVKASFVVFPSGETVHMSARSLGQVNVQMILEALGGGGNSTTAGGRVENTDVETVKSRLLEAIDAYFEK